MFQTTKAMLEKENLILHRRIARLKKQSSKGNQTKEVLHESGQDLRLLFETLPLGVVYQDAEGRVI